MNILYVITRGDTIGGAQVHVMDMARRVIADGNLATVAVGSYGPMFDELKASKVPVVRVPALQKAIHPINDLRAVVHLRDVIRQVRPDLVSCHSSKAGIIGRIAARLCSTPCIFTAHGWSFTEGTSATGRFVYSRVERLLAPLAARIICVSEGDRQLGLNAHISSSRMVTIHNGMPAIPDHHLAQPASARPMRVVMVARFDAQKDQSTLIRALVNVPNVRVDFVGDGPTRAACMALAERLGLAGRVGFLGIRRNISRILADADAFALISNWEGFPRSTLEAMRAGLPVVVSDVGGAVEAIEPGVTGFAVPRGDVQAVASAISTLAEDVELRRRMGEAARVRFQRNFTFEQMYRQTNEVYADSYRIPASLVPLPGVSIEKQSIRH